MQAQLNTLKKLFLEEITDGNDFEQIEKDYLGKKGKLNEILKCIKDLSAKEKKIIGPMANTLKIFILGEIKKKKKYIIENQFKEQEQNEKIDVTLEFERKNIGHKHPISSISEFLEEIFISLGFKVEDGPQIEIEDFNFEKLNIPDNHPARDVWDTFWLDDKINNIRKNGEKYLLRTHTSPVQIRTMLKGKLPIKIIVPGRVFRYEQEDARHTCNFYQLEGLVIGKGVTFGNLKWTLETAMKKLLGKNTKLRFRPSIFPFTEPSAEIDVSCQICKETGIIQTHKCSMCSGTGWVELLGAGMVHPKVLEGTNIDPKKYSGFAFGIGIDRIASQKYGVHSSRMFYQSKLKLNEQF